MNFRRSDSDIDPNSPFKDDLLNRAGLATRLANFLSKTEGPLTMALTGAFGSGKTHFLRRCQVLFERRGIPTVLVNAWETDFASEPIAPIISELADKFSGRLGSDARRWKKTKEFAAKMAAASIPLAVKLLTAGILDAEDLTDGAAIGDAVEKLAEKQFEHFEAGKKNVIGFKKEIAALAEKIRGKLVTAEPGEPKSAGSPIVVIIDELDRCRPSYAVEVLEVLKHFFDVPGIVFILGIDRAQLISAATAVFGLGLDGDGYLRRFIDIECSLPTPDTHDFCMSLGNSESLLSRWRQSDHLALLDQIARLCQGAGFSLRKTHQFMLRATIAATAASAISQISHPVILVFLREYDKELYDGFVSLKTTAWEVVTRLRTLDAQFGYPTYHGGIPFIDLFAAIGNDQPPKPFIELLQEDYDRREIKARMDYLRQQVTGNWRSHLKQISECVDFCVGFDS